LLFRGNKNRTEQRTQETTPVLGEKFPFGNTRETVRIPKEREQCWRTDDSLMNILIRGTTDPRGKVWDTKDGHRQK